IWLLGRLWHQVLLFFIALLIAAALDPLMLRLERHGWPRGLAVASLMAVFVGIIALLLTLVVPPVIQQGERLAENLPGYVEDLQGMLAGYPTVQEWLQQNANQTAGDPKAIFGGVLSFGTGIFSGIASILILIALTVYLLLDGPRLFAWLTGSLSPARAYKAERMRRDVSHVVGAYVRGQLIVSTLFGIFTYITLSLAGTPEPLLLAVLAAFLDAVPLVGATLATVPAVLLTLTVSPAAALIVLAIYIVYQQVENYVIIPRVFRGALQIPSLVVLVAVIVGSGLLGIVGALLSLPVAAAIPALVRAWREVPPAAPQAPSLEAESPGEGTD
ncbi:MAG TPA: AI-2E family transporter, partial [Thermomicrobiaceae bacterium]|nr:AI-2E family transporter [Thermomicrobiaceae bacterium]